MNAATKTEIVNRYPALFKKALELVKGDTKKANQYVFRVLQQDLDASLTDGQIRGVLVAAGIYNAHNPRQERKKGGKKKSDWVAMLESAVGTELPSANKLTIVDIQAILEALNRNRN